MGFWPVVNRVLEDCDILIVVRDARVPDLSRNEELESKINKSRKMVFEVFNKIDLISKSELEELKAKYPEGIFAVSTKRQGTEILKKKLIEKASMTDRALRIGVVGYPNMGKSALINALAGQHKVKVASVAGTTKGSQWVRITDNILMIDTPGVIPFSQKDDHLVLLAAKNPEKIKELERAAYVIVRYLLQKRTESLKKYAGTKTLPKEVDEILELIGKKKNFLVKGGLIDMHRTSTQIIRDWQQGKIK